MLQFNFETQNAAIYFALASLRLLKGATLLFKDTETDRQSSFVVVAHKRALMPKAEELQAEKKM